MGDKVESPTEGHTAEPKKMSAPQYTEFDNFSLVINFWKYSLVLLFLNILIAITIQVGALNNLLEDIPSIPQQVTMALMIAIPVLFLMITKRLLKNTMLMPLPS